MTDISDISKRNATVNVTINLPYQSEHQPTTNYIVTYNSLDWPNEPTQNVYSFKLTPTDIDRLANKSALLLSDCFEHTGWPQSTAQPVWDSYSLYYNTSYQLHATACGEDMCSIGNAQVASFTFRTIEHSPTCPPVDVQLIMTGKNSVKVTYRELDIFCLHGLATGYGFLLFETVRNYDLLETPWNMTAYELEPLADFKVMLDPGTLEHEFFGLYSYWNYTVIGFAVNGIGYGYISDPVEERTDEDGKLIHNLFTNLCKSRLKACIVQ